MALTFRRWVMIAVVGFAIIPVLMLREREPRQRERSSARERLAIDAARARRSQVRMAEMLYRARLHDSVRASLPRSTTSRTIVDPRITQPIPTLRNQTDALLADVARLRPSEPRMPVDIIVVLDTATTFRGHLRQRNSRRSAIDHLAPLDSTGRCTIVARVNPRGTWGNLTDTDTQDRFMGPCGFYEAYGLPGPQIRQWLDSRGWAMAQYGPQPLVGGWYMSRDWARADMRPYVSLSAFRCLTGSDSACVETALEPTPIERRLVGLSGALALSEYDIGVPWRYSGRQQGFGPRQASMLGDMAISLGPDRFGAFWRSSLPPMEAFREATGRDFPSWAREWMHAHYPDQETGPTTTREGVAFALLIIIAGVVLAGVAAQRRQVA